MLMRPRRRSSVFTDPLNGKFALWKIKHLLDIMMGLLNQQQDSCISQKADYAHVDAYAHRRPAPRCRERVRVGAWESRLHDVQSRGDVKDGRARDE